MKKLFQKINISFKLRITGTRLLSITLLVFMWCTIRDIPMEGRAFYGITITGIIVFLYTGKNVMEYKLKKRKEDTKNDIQ